MLDVSEIKIVPLAKSEFERLKKLRLRSLSEAPAAFNTTLSEALAWPEEKWIVQAETIPTFIATNGILDFGMVRFVQDKLDIRRAWLISMWVAPEARGFHVASRLIDAATDWSRERNYEILQLDVGNENIQAIALYAKKGFVLREKLNPQDEENLQVAQQRRELRLKNQI